MLTRSLLDWQWWLIFFFFLHFLWNKWTVLVKSVCTYDLQVACRAKRVRWKAAPCHAHDFRSRGRHSRGGYHHQKPPGTASAIWTGSHLSFFPFWIRPKVQFLWCSCHVSAVLAFMFVPTWYIQPFFLMHYVLFTHQKLDY